MNLETEAEEVQMYIRKNINKKNVKEFEERIMTDKEEKQLKKDIQNGMLLS